ncbi:MAG: hypothetical protein IBJ11_05325 [Phycisphaerales bacterium]|nr:hypothetical protein [Phycisphaerales bacterium]
MSTRLLAASFPALAAALPAAAGGHAPDDLRAAVAELLADADARTSLLAEGASAGYDSGFIIKDAGGYSLKVNGLVQFRYTANFRGRSDSASAANPDGRPFTGGFNTRFSKLRFSGTAHDPSIFWGVNGEFLRGNNGRFILEDAFVGWRFADGWSFRGGQYKIRFWREWDVSDEFQLTADRSMTDKVFRGGRSQGLELAYTGETIRGWLQVHDGFLAQNSDFGTNSRATASLSPAGTDLTLARNSFGFARDGGEGNFAVTLRAEAKWAGTWDNFKDFTSAPGSGYAGMAGVAGHIQGSRLDLPFRTAAGPALTDAAGNPYTGDTILGAWTADLTMKGDGWNAFLAGVGQHTRTSVNAPAGSPAVGSVSTSDFGALAQFGFYLPDTKVEPFARWDGIFADGDPRGFSGSDRFFNTLTVGANYFIHGHAAKLTCDVQWFPNRTNALGGNDPTRAYLAPSGRNQVALRFQFQLLF